MAKQRKTPPNNGEDGRKIRFVPGTYDPQEMAGYMKETPEVTVSKQGAPWVKYMREYERKTPMDQFVNQKKRAYLRLHPGLNKSAGVTMENFPTDVLQNFIDEYEYNKNSYVTKKYGKETGFNPNRRGEWVDEISPTFKDRFVANSKYESKLKPSLYSRGLAGGQEMANFLIKQLPGEQGDVLQYQTPGLTRREQKEIGDSGYGALEMFAPLDAPGAAMANYLKNVGLSTGSDYRERPGVLSGQMMSNVTDLDAAALNPINWTAPGDIAALVSLAPKAATLVKNIPGALDRTVASGLGKINEGLSARAGSRYDMGPVTQLPVEAEDARLKFLTELEDAKRTITFANNTSRERQEAALLNLAKRSSLPDNVFEQVTGRSKKALLGEEPPISPTAHYHDPLPEGMTVDDMVRAREEASAARDAELRAQGVNPEKEPPPGYTRFGDRGQGQSSWIPEPTQRRVEPDVTQQAGDLDIDNQLPPPPDEVDINVQTRGFDLTRPPRQRDQIIDMMNADAQRVRDINAARTSLEQRIAEINARLGPGPDNPAGYVRRDLTADPDFALDPTDLDPEYIPSFEPDPEDYITYADETYDDYDLIEPYTSLTDYGRDQNYLNEQGLFDFNPQGYTEVVPEPPSMLQRFTESIQGVPSRLKELFEDSETGSELNKLSKLYKGMYEMPTARYADEYAAPTLYARNYASPREMYTGLTNRIDTAFSDAKKGDIITGSTNTSYNSYVPQMSYLFENAGKEGLSQPIFLGYEPMNSSGFLENIYGIDVSRADILAHLNKQLNTIQKKLGKNLNFKNKPVYIDENDNIMLPQYGLKKLKDGPIKLKKRRYGGNLDKLNKFTK